VLNRSLGARRLALTGGAAALALALGVAGVTAAAADDGGVAYPDQGRGFYLTSANGSRFLVTIGDDGRLVETPAPASDPTAAPTSASPTTTPPPVTTSPTPTTPASNPVGLVVTSTGPGAASVAWNKALTAATYGRDGKDSTGYGAWTSPAGAVSPQGLTQLVAGATYNVTVAGILGGASVSQTVVFKVPAAAGPTVTASPTSSAPAPTSTPTATASPTSSAPVVTSPAGWPAVPTSGPVAGWLSGSSGPYTANGQHAAWRGTPETVGRTWVSDANPDVTIRAGAEYGAWKGSLDLGLPGVSSTGEWASCATGACDARWTTELQKLKAAWTSTDRGGGVLFISLAWEMNGSWFAHHVDPANPAAFASSWKRFRALQLAIFPASKLVYNANRDTSGLSYDWRTAIPGYTDTPDHSQVARYVDVMGVDYYDDWSSASTTQAQFDSTALLKDGYGAPVGIEAHRQLAQSLGLPLSVPEWSGDFTGQGSTGDAPSFPTAMHAFFAAHAGVGPGQVVYEVNYADPAANSGKFVYYSTTLMPKASAAYQAAF
jgi:hypothetical protein